MIEKNLSTLTINKLTKEQFEQALAQHRIQADQLYMVPDDSSDEGQYLPLTGGVLTGNDGSTIGLYPNTDDEAGEPDPRIEINNNYGDYAKIDSGSIDLHYGNSNIYLSAEEGITMEDSNSSAKIYSDNLQIQNSETTISISALEGEYGDITLQENAFDSSAHLSSAGILSLQFGDTNLYVSAEESQFDFSNGNGDKTFISPEYISVNNSNTEGSAELSKTGLVLRNDDSSVTASLSIEDNGYLKLHSDETRYDIDLSVEEGAIYVSLNQDEEYCILAPRNLILETATGSVSLDDSSIVANGAKLTFPTKTGTLALTSDLTSKADDYSIEIYNGVSGNPRPVKFISVDYSSCNSENGVAIKFGMVSGHGNGSSYAFLQDVIIKVTHTGVTTVDNFKYYGAAISYEGANRQYGDIFWVHNADTKVVDFYALMGQYARMQMAPWKRVTYSTGGSITQYSSATGYSEGTKEWGNNSEIALMSDLANVAKLKSANDMLHNGNEFTFVPSGYEGQVYINHKTSGGVDGNITNYYFGNGKGGLATFIANYFKGKFQGDTPRPIYNNEEAAMMSDVNALEARLAALENSVVAVLSGTAEPTNDIGEDGDIYLVTE